MFITVSALLIAMMGPTLRSNAGTWSTDIGYQIIGGVGYNMFDPTNGYNVSGLIADTWDHEADTNMHYDGSTYGFDDDFTVAVIYDSTEVGDWAVDIDPILLSPLNPIGIQFDVGLDQENLFSHYVMVFYEYPFSIYDWTSSAEIALPLQWFVTRHVEGTNQSVVDFVLRGGNYTMLLTTPGPAANWAQFVSLGIFTLQMSVSNQSLAESAEASLWTTVARLATAQLPNTHWIINSILAVIFWTPMGFAIVEFFRRWIPFLS